MVTPLTLLAALVGVARAVAFFVPAEDGELVVTIVGSTHICQGGGQGKPVYAGRAEGMVSGAEKR